MISKTQAECGDIEVKDKKIERRRILAFASAKKEKVGKAKNFPTTFKSDTAVVLSVFFKCDFTGLSEGRGGNQKDH